MRFILLLLLVGVLTLPGCQWAAEKIGLAQTAEQKEEAARKLKQADQLVEKWAGTVEPSGSGGFVRREGITEMDPWGNYIRIRFHQKWFQEIAIIQSAGPDGVFDNDDDLLRQRSTGNVWGILGGIPIWLYVIGGWLAAGALACLLATGLRSRRQRRGRRKKVKQHSRPVLAAFITLFFGGLSLLFYGFMYLGILTVDLFDADIDFFDNFDFDGDIDIDIDLDL
jgi:hypothetical protein